MEDFFMLRKILGVFVAFLSWVIFLLIVVVGLIYIWPDYRDAGLIVNFIFLSIAAALAFWVYYKINPGNYENVSDNVENVNDSVDSNSYSYDDIIKRGQSRNNDNLGISVKDESKSKNTGIKIGIGVLSVVVMVLAGLFLIGVFVGDDMSNSNVFNDSNISFKYPGDWVIGNSSDFYLVLEGDYILLNMNISDSEGFFVDNVADKVVSEVDGSSLKLLFKNVTSVDGVKAYDIGLAVNKDDVFQSRFLVFVVDNKEYVFVFNTDKLDNINDPFNLIKNSIKVK